MCCITPKADAFAKKLGYAVPLQAGLIKPVIYFLVSVALYLQLSPHKIFYRGVFTVS